MSDEAKARRNEEVRVYTSMGRLVISIGIDLLANAANRSPAAERDDGEFDKPPKWRVTNADVFAEAVVEALNDEGEDGSTPIHRLLDEAFQSAADEGCDGIEEWSEMNP